MRKVIFWDFDDTLAYQEDGWTGCMAQAIKHLEPKTTITRSDIKPFLKNSYPWHYPEKSHTDIKTADEWWHRFGKVSLDAYLSLGVKQELAENAVARLREKFCCPSRYFLFEDTVPTLKKLKECGWEHYVLSNHVPELPKLIENFKIDYLLNDVFNSADIGYEKPNPKIFEYALGKVGRVDQIWMIGDNPVADIDGSKAMGLKSILVRKQHQTSAPFCKNLNEVVEILKNA